MHTQQKMRLVRLSVALLMASAAGCENNDPCVRREAACVDVGLFGGIDQPNDPLLYRDLTIRVKGSDDQDLVPPVQVAELKQTAPAGIVGLVKIQLPDSFNTRADDKAPKPEAFPADACDAPASARVQALGKLRPLQQQFRNADPRAVRVVVSGKEVRSMRNPAERAVLWDSRVDEDACFSPNEICYLRYVRAGKADPASVRALLDVPITACSTDAECNAATEACVDVGSGKYCLTKSNQACPRPGSRM